MRSSRSNTAGIQDEGNALQADRGATDNLPEFEKEVYDFIKERGEILTSNLPMRMRGAIPSLKNKGVIEVFKKRTSRWATRKRKFVRVEGSRSDS